MAPPRTRSFMRLVLAGFCLAFVLAACGGGAATTTTAGNVPLDDARIRQVEAVQTRNPDWIVRLDDAGHLIATSRHVSLFRDDIRTEVDIFLRDNASELGLGDPSVRRVRYEPDHVRYESAGAGSSVDARLRDGAIVVTQARAVLRP